MKHAEQNSQGGSVSEFFSAALKSLKSVVSEERMEETARKLAGAPEWERNRIVYEFLKSVEEEWEEHMREFDSGKKFLNRGGAA